MIDQLEIFLNIRENPTKHVFTEKYGKHWKRFCNYAFNCEKCHPLPVILWFGFYNRFAQERGCYLLATPPDCPTRHWPDKARDRALHPETPTAMHHFKGGSWEERDGETAR